MGLLLDTYYTTLNTFTTTTTTQQEKDPGYQDTEDRGETKNTKLPVTATRGLRLLSLPIDVRLLILEQLLVSEGPVRDLIPDGFCHKIRPGQLEKDHICGKSNREPVGAQGSWLQRQQQQRQHTPCIDASVLRVCRQLYDEGLPLLFQNTFQFTSIQAIEHFQGSAIYAFLRPRVRHVELVLSIDAFDTPMWFRLAPVSQRIQVDGTAGRGAQNGLRDDMQPFLAAWRSAEATRQEALGPTRYLDSLTLIFRNWSWKMASDRRAAAAASSLSSSLSSRRQYQQQQQQQHPRPKFPHTLSKAPQRLLLATSSAMLRQGYPAQARICKIRGLGETDSVFGRGAAVRPILSAAENALMQRKEDTHGEDEYDKNKKGEESFRAAWMAFEDSLGSDLLAHLNGRIVE